MPNTDKRLREEAERRIRATRERNLRWIEDSRPAAEPFPARHAASEPYRGIHSDKRMPPPSIEPIRPPQKKEKRGLMSLLPFDLGNEELLILGLIFLLWKEEDGLPMIAALAYLLLT